MTRIFKVVLDSEFIMWYLAVCDFCLKEFSDKIQSCGHSICTPCLKIESETASKCPKCGTELDVHGADDYFTNNLELENNIERNEYHQQDDLNDQNGNNEDHNCSDRTNQGYDDSDSDWVDYDSNGDEDNTDGTVDEEEEFEEYEFDKEKEWFYVAEEDSDEVSNTTETDTDTDTDTETEYDSEFDYLGDHLKEIYSFVKGGGEIYVSKWIGKSKRYAKISVYENKILVHAFSKTNKPKQCREIELDDLKRFVTYENLLAFMVLPSVEGETNLITIKLFSSELSSQFYKLCTGECGPTYKTSPYTVEPVPKIKTNNKENGSEEDVTTDRKEKDESFIFEVVEYMSNGKPSLGQIDYISSYTGFVNVVKDEMYLTGDAEENFLILKALEDGIWYNTFGKIESSPDQLKHKIRVDRSQMILDCGIAFNLPSN